MKAPFWDRIPGFRDRDDPLRLWLEIGNLNARTLDIRCHNRLAKAVPEIRFDFALPQCNNLQNSPRAPLALGLWIVMMEALSCGATGTRPRGVP